MGVRIFKGAVKVGVGVVCAIGFIGLGAATAQATESDSTLAGLSSQSVDLYRSDEPKTIRINPATGKVLSVTPGEPIQTRGVQTNCSGDVACWNGQPPALSYGFNGSGGSGNWPNRSSFQSKNYTALVCWSYGNPPFSTVHCTPEDERLGKNATIQFGSVVTGTKVSLSR